MKKSTFPIAIVTFLFLHQFVYSQAININDDAPVFKLKNIDGKYISLNDYKNYKGAIIIFTCNHCPFAKAYEDRIIQLHKQYESKGFPVIAINPNDSTIHPDDSYSNMQLRAKQKKYPFVYLLDEKQTIYPKYGATKTPHSFVLKNDNGTFKLAYIGAIDDNTYEPQKVKLKYIENAIKAILNGTSPNPAQTKAIGCTIK